MSAARPKPTKTASRPKSKAEGASSRSLDPGAGEESGPAAASGIGALADIQSREAAASGGRSVDPAAPADVLMEGVVEKLKLLGYEEAFCRASQPVKKPLHRLSFVMPHASPQDQTQAYYYMVDLVLWLLRICGLGASPEPALDDNPAQVLAAIQASLRNGGFSSTGLTLQKMQQAWGDAVCGLLDALTDLAIETAKIKLEQPIRGAEEGGDEVEVVEEEESDDADVVDVVGHGLEDSFDGELALPALGGTGGLPGLGKKQEAPGPDREERAILTARNVDAERWRAEVERQAPKLRLTTDARDWRSHVDQAAGHAGEMSKALPESRALLDRLHQRLAEELDKLATRERNVNDTFEALRGEYRAARQGLDTTRQRYNLSADEVARLTNELQRCEAEVRDFDNDQRAAAVRGRGEGRRGLSCAWFR